MTLHTHYTRRFWLFTLYTLFVVPVIFSSGIPLEAQTDRFEYEIAYEIDRSGLPPLYFQEITVGVAVGDLVAYDAQTGDGETLEGFYDAQDGLLFLTTASDEIVLTFTTETNNPRVGSFGLAPLRDNKLWAWSHGLDDNRFLEESIALFERREWVGTLFLIGRFVEDSFDFEDALSADEVASLLDSGWSLGNHTYDDPYCFETDNSLPKEEEILRGHEVLREIITAAEARPNYVPLSFGAPCFSAQYDVALNKLLQNRRKDGSFPLYNESQGVFTIRVDAGITGDAMLDGQPVASFDLERVIGRDGRIDGGNVTDVLQHIDWVSRQADKGIHLWYNSLSHGPLENSDNEEVNDSLDQMIEHIYREYGPWGTDEVWVAPSDAIYSYLLIREKADFAVGRFIKNGETLDPEQAQQFSLSELTTLESIPIFPTVERPVDTPIPIQVMATPVETGGGASEGAVAAATESEPNVTQTPTPAAVSSASDTSVAESGAGAQSGQSGSGQILRVMFLSLIVVLVLTMITAAVLGYVLIRRAGRLRRRL